MKSLLNVLFILLPFNIFCQSIRLSGTVFDKDTQLPAPMVSISTQDHKIGTVSTVKGIFLLDIPISKKEEYLYFTSIGYETDSVQIYSVKNPLSVQLTPKTYSLKEIYVIPDSTLFTLLRKAYDKIPENYPDYPTRYEGFFQETTSQNGGLVEIIEAILSVYKESYRKKKEASGQIEIVKSRIKQLQDVRFGSLGGPFLPVNLDPVLQRKNYIVPQKMKQYRYKFSGIANFHGKECYEIEFYNGSEDNEKGMQGTILIDKETLAYVLFEVNSQNKDNEKFSIGPISPVETKTKMIYEQLNGKWYLKQISTRHKHKSWRLKTSSYTSIDFIVTQIQTDSVKPIPIERRLEYMVPIEAKTETYNPKGWTDSDVLANESDRLGFQFSPDEAILVFQRNIPKEFSVTKTITSVLPKLILSYGISYNPVSFDKINTNIIFQPNFDTSPFVLSGNKISIKENILLQSILGYRISKKWHLFWQSSSDFMNKEISSQSNSLGIKYRKNLNNAGYPVFLGASVLILDRSYYRDLGSQKNITAFTYNYKKFDAKELAFGYGIREQTIVPQISLSKRMSKFITMEIYAGYHFPIYSENSIKIKEKDGFPLFRKSTTIKLNDNNLIIDNPIALKNSISTNRLEIGIMFYFF